MNKLEENKKALIDIITWYRDEYHKTDFGHTDMITTIQKIDKSLSNKFLRSHLTKRNLCVKLFL